MEKGKKKSWFVIRKVQNGNGAIGVKMADGREEGKRRGDSGQKGKQVGIRIHLIADISLY